MRDYINSKLLATVALICLCLSQSALGQERTSTVLRNGWKFAKGEQANAFAPAFKDADWEEVAVPHDWAIEGPFEIDGNGSTGKLPWKGQGWYRNELEIPASAEGKRVYLIFDGVMAFPKVYLNGENVGEWDYGYNSFYLDVTNAVKFGEDNLLAVHADTREHGSRWYPGAGMYRKVTMVFADPIHAEVWGTYITTPIVKPNYADVRISTAVKNTSSADAEVMVLQKIFSPDGIEVGQDTISRTVKAGRTADLEVDIRLIDPERWDVENPALYTAETHILSDGNAVDITRNKFGVRTIAFTADDGFHLNGRRVQLKGVNLHHGHGPLGAAFNKRAMQRQLEIMKSMGVNAIRNSHNTAAPELLELCDEMGLLMFNEVFDKYDNKADILEDTDFDEFAHRNIKSFVTRDRNHPSIFLWSVGNEIGDVQWNINNGFKRLHTMLNYVNKYDPTRPTTLVNDNMEGASMRHFDLYDVHAWNYGRRYRLARQMEPNKSVVISESASTVSTRGFYEFPLPEEKTDFTKSLQVSSYDLNAPDWAEIGDDDFMWQQDEPYIAGEFVWTGFDYLGEPTPYDNRSVKGMGFGDKEASRSSYFGIVDMVGIPKDRYYLYKSYWMPDEKTIHILPHWNWPDRVGKNVPVFVYTNGDKAELFLNGKSQGFQQKDPASKNSVERFRLMWRDVVYEPGELKVVVYKNGELLGEQTLSTTGEATNLKLTADRDTIEKGGEDLSYVMVEATDADGNPHPWADGYVEIDVKGSVEIAGVGNGNPQSFEPFQVNRVKLFYGKAMIILRSTNKAGKATVTVKSDGLKKSSVELQVK
ncbi:glycoside hydrolase family 2 TIM barrel-domain containing protein [Roseivirga pacifica]|uniref:glycoside hydrolase family 2 TIM barrel-domain containing protein n=1 Tax=Roseivirga pacifica TaxID=1267423 RepID=UPI00227A3B02|nr:glycoside hydrolase family 2 TIM barrel-domain containing protein [Roseivirga pacifica]